MAEFVAFVRPIIQVLDVFLVGVIAGMVVVLALLTEDESR